MEKTRVSSDSLPDHLREQFATMDQQRETSSFGIWVFLLTEVMFFGALFTIYGAYHHVFTQAFEAACRHTDFWLGTANTAILLISSLFMALAVHAAKEGESRPCTLFLCITMTLGVIFLTLKGVEYAHHIHDYLLPGRHFQFEPAGDQHGAELFFYLYFAMTGLHALHMTIGVLVLSVIAFYSRRGLYTERYHNPVEVAGLYWHFVDIIWLFLFPLFYLIGGGH